MKMEEKLRVVTEDFRKNDRYNLLPVSYTHLDVYKRQFVNHFKDSNVD